MAQVCKSMQYRGSAEHWQDRASSTESLVKMSLRYEEALRDLKSGIDALLVGCVHDYDDFRMWEAQVRSDWARDPDSYCEEAHEEIKNVDRLWFVTLKRGIELIDSICPDLDLHIDNSAVKEFRDRYMTRLSIERMDHGPCRRGLLELADSALEEFEAGDCEDWTP